MNTYEKIYYENFRKKFAYAKTLDLIVKINTIIGSYNIEKNVQIHEERVLIKR